MADNFLEYHREDYELRKAQWIAKKKGKKFCSAAYKRQLQRPDDEAL